MFDHANRRQLAHKALAIFSQPLQAISRSSGSPDAKPNRRQALKTATGLVVTPWNVVAKSGGIAAAHDNIHTVSSRAKLHKIFSAFQSVKAYQEPLGVDLHSIEFTWLSENCFKVKATPGLTETGKTFCGHCSWFVGLNDKDIHTKSVSQQIIDLKTFVAQYLDEVYMGQVLRGSLIGTCRAYRRIDKALQSGRIRQRKSLPSPTTTVRKPANADRLSRCRPTPHDSSQHRRIFVCSATGVVTIWRLEDFWRCPESENSA